MSRLRNVHSYDPSRQPYQSHIPGMRPAREAYTGQSPTPIYDALYAEYRRSFRALPGDRTGEEHLGFESFGTGLISPRALTSAPQHYPGTGWQPYPVPRPAHVGHYPAALPPGPRRGV